MSNDSETPGVLMVNSNVYKTPSVGMANSVCQTFSAWPCNCNDYKNLT